jgi:Icc-related predicted phosphoesterase
MRLLYFSDLHNDTSAAEAVARDSANVDVVVGAGDYCNIHRGLESTLAILARVNCPCILVAGNAETTDELRNACRKHSHLHVLHGEEVTLEGITFFGIGGGIPVTPFGAWSYDFTEEEAAELLRPCPKGCILVSHSPPKGVLDMSSRGLSLGSTAVAEAIRHIHPIVVVCGHIHESGGKSAMMGSSVVVNAGPRFPQICVVNPTDDGEWTIDWKPRSVG